jgi:acetyl esterase/lipase
MDISKVDSELQIAINQFAEALGGTSLDLSDLEGARSIAAAIAEQASLAEPATDRVEVESVEIHDEALNIDVKAEVYRPITSEEPMPAILFIHGGGYVMGAATQANAKLSRWCEELEAVVVSVEYRLAPEFPFPAALHDCFAVLKWMSSYAEKLSINPSRIALLGESAGGGLAAGLALYARDHSEIQPVFQALIYPMLDPNNVAPASNGKEDTYIWSRENNRVGWEAYLGESPDDSLLPYAAPALAEDLSGLPAAYIPVGSLDLFLEENKVYAARLIDARVQCDTQIYDGGFHAFSSIAPEAKISKKFEQDLTEALRKGLVNRTG